MEIEKQVAELVNEKVTTAKKETESKIDSVKSELASAIELKHNEISHSLVEAKSELMEVKNALSEMTKTSHKEEDKSIYAQVDKYIDDNIEAMKAQFKSGSGVIEIAKAVGTMTTANGTLPTALPANYVAQTQGVPLVRFRRPKIFQYANVFSTNQKTLPYVEAIPKEGDFAVVAEGGVKPQLDFSWVTRFIEPNKYAGWIKVTEELLYDIPRFKTNILDYIKNKHDLFKEKQVFTYLNTAATAFVTASVNTASVVNPNIIDVVNAMNAQIVNTPNYTDEPEMYGDVVLMNYADIFKYFSAVKDATGRNLYGDDYNTTGMMRYNGYTFIFTPLVTAGNIVLYDSSKLDVSTYMDYVVKYGLINDDFIKNEFVTLGESRGHIYIKNHDKRAFVKGTIATIMADITKP